ncbi:MAG: TonB-dependent receptor [Tannerella sp.]|jgi:hypothetical protein|nr:TonB-dependent receptor [Tannerella sp.]
MKAIQMKRIMIAAITAITISGALHAQEPDPNVNREMTLEREYDPSVQDANKVNLLPEVWEPVVNKRPIDYATFTLPADPKKEFNRLPSGDLMTEIPYNHRRGYFHFGGGMYMNFDGDAGYHILDNEKDRLNLFVTHHSTNGEVTDIRPGDNDEKRKAKLNDNFGGFGLEHHFDRSTLRLGADYGYTAFNYYSFLRYLPVINIEEDAAPSSPDEILPVPLPVPYPQDIETNQVNQTLRGYAGVRSKEDAGTGYLFDVEFLQFSQRYGRTKDVEGIHETKITPQFGLSRLLGEGNQSVGFNLKADWFNYTYPSTRTDSTGYRNHFEATLTPYYRIKGETWRVQLGLNVMLITGDSAKVFVSPAIEAGMQITPRTLFYVNAGGGIYSNDPSGLARRNRYMDYYHATLPTRTWLDASLGIRSAVTPDVWLNLFAGGKISENEVFFVPAQWDTSSDFQNYANAFQPDATVLHVGAAFKYTYRQWVDFSLKGIYYHCTFRDGDATAQTYGVAPADMEPYGFPNAELYADIAVKPMKPLSLNLGYYLGYRRCTLWGSELEPMDHFNDLHFTATWQLNDTFGAYVKLNNLLFQQQEWVYGYPMQGFNAMLGINLNF